MFKIALTFLSLVLPILAVPMSPNDGLVQRAGSPISGSVRAIHSRLLLLLIVTSRRFVGNGLHPRFLLSELRIWR